MEKIPNNSSCYTLNGSQPYVLTANWPNGFIIHNTYFKADYSMANVLPNSGIKEYAGVSYPTNYCSFDQNKTDNSKYSIVSQMLPFEKTILKNKNYK